MDTHVLRIEVHVFSLEVQFNELGLSQNMLLHVKYMEVHELNTEGGKMELGKRK